MQILNSAGEIVKILPITELNGATGSTSVTTNPDSSQVFVPGGYTGAGNGGNTGETNAVNGMMEIYYMGQVILWDGTNEQGVLINNGLYTIQVVNVDENGYRTVAQTQVTVLNVEQEVITNVKIMPNPLDLSLGMQELIIRYNVMNNTNITVKIYNLAGELVKTLRSYNGVSEIRWNIARNETHITAGIYVAVIYAKNDNGRYKSVIVKLSILR